MITKMEFDAIREVVPEIGYTTEGRMSGWIALLEKIQNQDRFDGETPKHTYDEFVSQVGKATANFTIASLVNNSAWDGRISLRNAEWARLLPASFSDEVMIALHLYTTMHMCHLDQIADEARKATVNQNA